MRDFIKQNTTSVSGIAVSFLIGLFLLLFPKTTANVVFFLVGAALIATGVVKVIQYFTEDAHRAVGGWQLATGILLALGGIAMLVLSKALLAFVPFVFGCALLVGGVLKLQSAFDMRRMNAPKWQMNLIGVGISALLGIIIIFNPFSTAITLMRVIGVSLIVEAVQDALCLINFNKVEKKF